MNPEDLLKRIQRIRVWSDGDRRAPHKPLLMLWTIGQCLGNQGRLTSFEVIDSELIKLIKRFGPHNRYSQTHYPFWRLQTDNVWEIDRPHLVNTTSSGDAHRSDLMRHSIRGGLRRDDSTQIRTDPQLALDVIFSLLDAHFPELLHEDILRAVGLDKTLEEPVDANSGDYVFYRRRRRYGAFRAGVLDAYGEQCAVCAFSVRMEDAPLAIDAAHIRWHAARGPSEARNGLALCALHHRLFDYGAFTVLPELKVIVSSAATGQGFTEALGQYHGENLRVVPNSSVCHPGHSYLAWHNREVFQTPYELSG